MGIRDITHRAVVAAAPTCLVSGLLFGSTANIAQASQALLAAPADAGLLGVSASSPSNAWAVGFQVSGQADRTLTEHWNGKAWQHVKSLSPGGVGHTAELLSVSTLSKSNAWAVGFFSDGTLNHSLIEHWNGHAWKVFPPPVQGCTPGDVLSSVKAISPSNVWAVGTVTNCFSLNATPDTFHWNGTAWHEVRTPNPGQSLGGELMGVDATSATNVWAVGDYPTGQAQGRLSIAMHWNGTKWRVVKSPSVSGPSLLNALEGVSVSSRTNAWAVGFSVKAVPHASFTVALHWNGKVWKHVPTPHPAHGNGDALTSVDALSAGTAFAVGNFRNAKNLVQNAAMQWNGRTWNLVRSPAPAAPKESGLTGVVATSAANAWAVGFSSVGNTEQVIILRWNGKTWRRQV